MDLFLPESRRSMICCRMATMMSKLLAKKRTIQVPTL